MPLYLWIYDVRTDPEDHVTHYVTVMKGNNLTKEHVSSILLKKFGETLTRGALTWYSQLPARSIENFEEMADKFVTAHAGAKKAETRVNNIFAIKQPLGDRLRDFFTQFNRVRMTLPNVSEGMAVAAFLTGLSRKDIVYALEKLEMKVKWLPKMRSDPSTRKSVAVCEFHQERGHKIEDCIALRQEVVNMLQQGNLKELLSDKGRNNFARGHERQGLPKPLSPAHTINMIIDSNDYATINDVKFTATHKLKRSITHVQYNTQSKYHLR
ncbi:uncharacterized protein [Nicotiana tomentosiformis]|uniref:uncharacterized protein n=1 Tax=Nicotiana tomentosiformis TaxID=4098 RepID=UPI00388CE6D3